MTRPPYRRHPSESPLSLHQLSSLGSRGTSLDGFLSAFSSPDANGFLNVDHEHFPIVDSSGSRFTNNGSNRAPDTTIRNYNFEFKLRHKFAVVFAAARDACVNCVPT